MDNTTSKNELFLLVDIDDLLVHSSDKLQAIVNEKTNFKTDVLRMLEQLNRNCRYFASQVKKECDSALSVFRKPNLERFVVFDKVSFHDYEYFYKPIMICEDYVKAANELLNQFLEERDTFLEIDNMPKGGIKTFNYKKEMESINHFAELISKYKDSFHKINCFCLKAMIDLIRDAKKRSTSSNLIIPDYGALVSMDKNDIIKKSSLSGNVDNKTNILYQKPLDDITNCLNLEDRIFDIITNAKVFLTPSAEIVDYRMIHSLKNVDWDAVALVEDLIHTDIFKGVYFSTHHNGNREEKAKKILMQQIIPEATGFIGQRFHCNEHNGVRRGRSSKIDMAVDYLDISPSQIVLFDDSIANCNDCKEKGGTEVLYKPATDSEIINGKLADIDYNRVLDFKINHMHQYVAEAYEKQKVKIK